MIGAKTIGEIQMILATENLFTNVDHAIVRSAVKRLPALLGVIVEMRFWNKNTLVEISAELGVSVRSVETALAKAATILREECLRNPVFSRSKYHTIQLINEKIVA